MKQFIAMAAMAISSTLCAVAQNVSEDLLMHEFDNGPVKRYVTLRADSGDPVYDQNDLNTMWIYFDTNGTLLRDGLYRVFVYDQNGRYVRGQFNDATMQRNERGQISSVASGIMGVHDEYYEDSYTYNQYGRIVSEDFGSIASGGSISYKYDTDNNLIGCHWEYDAEGNIGEIDFKYDITRRDKYGNWTMRTVDRKEKELEDGKVISENKDSYVERRIIEYYAPGEKSVNSARFIVPVTVTGTNVRLRLGPSTKHEVYTKGGKTVYPPKGAKLKYLGETEEFYHVEYNGVQAYISKQFTERNVVNFLMN